MDEPTLEPCPTCKQYSHSLDEGLIGEACLHFETMFSHRGDGFATQHIHDAETRDMAQRMLAAITTLRAQLAERDAELAAVRLFVSDLAQQWLPDEPEPADDYDPDFEGAYCIIVNKARALASREPGHG
jgi:hypothetical protein